MTPSLSWPSLVATSCPIARPFPAFAARPRSDYRGSTAFALSARSAGSPTVCIPRRLVGSNRATLSAHRCRWNAGGSPPTCASPNRVSAPRPSAIRCRLRTRIFGTQEGRSRSHPDSHSASAYPPIPGNFWWARQWRLLFAAANFAREFPNSGNDADRNSSLPHEQVSNTTDNRLEVQ